MAAIGALLKRQGAVTDEEHAASLIRAFEFAAKLEGTLKDELQDIDGANKLVTLMDEIANALDAIGPGRATLAGLLDRPDDRSAPRQERTC